MTPSFRHPAHDVTARSETATGTLRSRVTLAALVAIFGAQSVLLSFGALFLVCGMGTCPTDGQLNGFSYVGLVTALVAAGLLGVPFILLQWARPRTRWITAAAVAGAVFLTLATIILFSDSVIGT